VFRIEGDDAGRAGVRVRCIGPAATPEATTRTTTNSPPTPIHRVRRTSMAAPISVFLPLAIRPRADITPPCRGHFRVRPPPSVGSSAPTVGKPDPG
jgi:hypothetical protein